MLHLVTIFTQLYIENEQDRQGKIQNVWFEEKCNEAKSIA